MRRQGRRRLQIRASRPLRKSSIALDNSRAARSPRTWQDDLPLRRRANVGWVEISPAHGNGPCCGGRACGGRRDRGHSARGGRRHRSDAGTRPAGPEIRASPPTPIAGLLQVARLQPRAPAAQRTLLGPGQRPNPVTPVSGRGLGTDDEAPARVRRRRSTGWLSSPAEERGWELQLDPPRQPQRLPVCAVRRSASAV
jgi:hypothetical protein